MKTYAKIKSFLVILCMGCLLVACECKVCTKPGENDVRVCRDNYATQEDYNQALGWYQLSEYSCN